MKPPRRLRLSVLGLAFLGVVLALPTARAGGVRTGRTSPVVHTPASRYPIRGASSAVLNVLYWAGFKNPTTQQVQKLLGQMLTRYRGKVRLQFMNKHRDGIYYQSEQYAAAVGREAFEQGGDRLFWKFHDEVLKHPNLYSLLNANVTHAARNAGLNLRRLRRAIATNRHTKTINAERDLAVRFGVPTYNSSVILMVGQELMYISQWTRWYYLDAVIKRNLAIAEAHRRKGLAPGQIHDAMVKTAKTRYKRWRRYGYRQPHPGVSRITKRHNISVGHSPARGPATAWVTVVAFLDFTDYSSGSAWSYLVGVQKQYKQRLRLVYKAMPRRYYSYALGAARAAYAAHAQGRFWKMATVLFQNRWRLYPAQLPTYAKQAGLDVPRFQRDTRSPSMSQRVLKDMQLARKLGVTVSPAVFINGRRTGPYWNQYVFAETLRKELKGGLLTRLFGR